MSDYFISTANSDSDLSKFNICGSVYNFPHSKNAHQLGVFKTRGKAKQTSKNKLSIFLYLYWALMFFFIIMIISVG